MTILEMQEKLIGLREELQNIITTGESEQRELADTETSRMVEIRNEIDSLEKQVKEEEQRNKQITKQKQVKTMEKEIRLIDLVRGIANHNVTDEMRQFVNGNKINLRSDPTTIQAGVATQGQENVPEVKADLETAIRNASVLNRIGATWFTNIVGDLSIPKYSGSEVGWKGEIETAEDGEGSFSEVLLQPKRLTAIVKISKTFLDQDSNDAESILIRDLADAVAEKLDETVFGASSGSTTQPAGLFYGDYVTTGGTLADVTYDNVLDLELAVEEANGRNFTFVAHPKMKYALKGTQMASGLQMVYSGNEIDGYPAIVSNSVVDGGILALEPKDLVVAVWRNTEILVDPYTLAGDNCIRLVVNMNVDAKLKGDRIAGAIFE